MTPGSPRIPNFIKCPCYMINPRRRASECSRSSHEGINSLWGGVCKGERANLTSLHTRTSAASGLS